MLPNNNFKECLSDGQKAENEVSYLLKHLFPKLIIKGKNDDKRCDLFCELDGKSILVEVKEDIKVKRTGFVVVEYESFGKPSGIVTTESDIWVFKCHRSDGIHYLMFGIKELKRIVNDHLWYDQYQMTTTDSSNKVYRFRWETMLNNCARNLITI